MRRREYDIDIIVNHRRLSKVIIDPHFEKKHGKSITDEIILRLVETLDGKQFEPESVAIPFAYFVNDRISLNGKFYKLIWLLEENEIFIGVVNAYRR